MRTDSPFLVRAVDGVLGSDSVVTRIYENVRHAILVGDLAQGTRLNEQKLSAALGVSRVPLREAMPLLQMHGFIEQRARRSAVVRTWTRERVAQLFDVRLAVEPAAARLAALAVRGGRDPAPLAAAIADADVALARGDDLEIAQASTLIHTRVIELTGNELLVALMDTISPQMTWLFHLTSRRDSRLACDEHHELLDVIVSGEGELAAASMYRHIDLGRRPTLAQVGDAARGPVARRGALELVAGVGADGTGAGE